MIVGSKKSKEYIENVEDIQIQQCGIDLRIGKIYEIIGEGSIDYDNKNRTLPDYKEIFDSEKDEKIRLNRGIYIISTYEKIKIPENMAGFVYPRSSILRMGCTIYSAVHDPGYEGHPQYLLNVLNPITIYSYARFGQIIYVKCSDVNGLYCGIYNEK